MNQLQARVAVPSTRTLLLASVTSPAEARTCLKAGADIIDAKNPAAGALGALPEETVRQIASQVAVWKRPVSATIGDLPCEPDSVFLAVERMARTGVDYVKIGFLPGGDPRAVIRELGNGEFHQSSLVGVLFADMGPDLALVEEMARAGFAGVLIDTADKSAGSLTRIVCREWLAEFVCRAREQRLFAGLAGSLSLTDIDELCGLQPDILGFRGALCLDSRRTFAIDEGLVQLVRARLDTASEILARAAG